MCSPDGEQAGAAPGPEDKTAAQPLTGESASPGPQKEESRLLSPSYFEMIPVQYRKGPWSPVSYVTLGGWMVVLLSMIPRMAQSYAQDVARIAPTPGDRSWWLTVAIATWCLALSAVMVRQWTIWPFFSYTLMCWSLLMLRCACAALGHYSHVALVAAEVLRFPALAGATITTVVWNCLLQFVIYYLLPPNRRPGFVKFNFQFLLVNIHVLNLPLAFASHFLTPRPLVFFDLWVTGVWMYTYALFYIFVIDARGFHLYPILTPRTHWCFFVYNGILGLLFGVYRLCQWIVE